jgi:hypothetical protein
MGRVDGNTSACLGGGRQQYRGRGENRDPGTTRASCSMRYDCSSQTDRIERFEPVGMCTYPLT